MKEVKVGDMVLFVDQLGVEHYTLVTAVWPTEYPETQEPGLNLVFVSSDADKSDIYGRQIERQSSIVHKKGQPAHGFYWKRLFEE